MSSSAREFYERWADVVQANGGEVPRHWYELPESWRAAFEDIYGDVEALDDARWEKRSAQSSARDAWGAAYQAQAAARKSETEGLGAKLEAAKWARKAAGRMKAIQAMRVHCSRCRRARRRIAQDVSPESRAQAERFALVVEELDIRCGNGGA